MLHQRFVFACLRTVFSARFINSPIRMGRALALLLLVAAFSFSQAALAQISFQNFENASLVIGQSDFTSLSNAVDNSRLPAAAAVALSPAGTLAAASPAPGRVLLWHTFPLANGQPADVVIGKPDFTTTVNAAPSAASMQDCRGVAFSPDGKKLLVSDALNNRVLIWNTLPTANGQPADVVIGQKNFTESSSGTAANKLNYPAGLFVSRSGQLLINDVFNNRVLVFNSIPTSNDAAADVILGQPAAGSNAPGSAANQMNRPWYSTLAPDGKLLVSDTNNHRVLVFGGIPTANGASAQRVIGQASFQVNPTSGLAANKLNTPLGLAVSRDGKLAIADFSNNRVLVYQAIPETNGQAADVVLGQPGFTTSDEHHGGVSARSLANTTGVQFDFNGRLLVSERKGQGANPSGRVLVFGSPSGQKADLAIGSHQSMSLACRDITYLYRVDIFNNGPHTATNAVVSFFIPAALSQPPSSPSVTAGTYSPEKSTWTLPRLQPGEAATILFTGTVAASFSGQVLQPNAVIRSADQVDPNLNNNATGAEVTVISNLPAAPAVSPVTVCTGNDTILTAYGQGTIRWYDAPSGGNLLYTGSDFDTGPLTATTTYYAEAFNSCISSPRTAVTVTVNQPLTQNTISGDQTVCQGQAVALLAGQVPAGGNGNYHYQWQISTDNTNWREVFPDNRDRQKDLQVGSLGVTSYFRRRVLAGPCAHSYSNVVTVQVNPLPAVSFRGLPTRSCTDAGPIVLTGHPSGGTFSGPGISGNTFYPNLAGPGNHFISYSYVNENQCRNSVTSLVIVGATVYPGASPSVCIDAPAFTLSGANPAGGTWTGPGVSAGGTFHPATAGVGTHALTYTVTSNFGCGTEARTVSATLSVQVRPLPVVAPGPARSVCIDHPEFSLTDASPTGGTWSGPGVSPEGVFSPRAAGLGTHTLTYRVNVNGCENAATRTITVNPPPTVSLAAFARQCSSTFIPVPLTGGFPAGGTYSGPGVSNNRFSPSLAGVGTHTITYTYTDANGCVGTATQPLTVEICTGVAEQQLLKTLAIFPNPTREELNLAFRMPTPGPLTIKLLSLAGQVVVLQEKTRQAGLYAHTFRLGGLAPGVYVLQIITEEALVSKRIILHQP